MNVKDYASHKLARFYKGTYLIVLVYSNKNSFINNFL